MTTPMLHRLRRSGATLLFVVCALWLSPAQAQDNNNAQPRTKSIARMSSSDAPNGAQVTITSDVELNDYSAYRSGDRFYVVIPQASAAGGGGLRGRGFDGAQVQRRGSDVVLSFKLQPGASARVNQRFNRLVVQFNAPNVGSTPPQNANQTAQANTNTQPRPAVENAGTPTPTPTVRPTPAQQTAQTQLSPNGVLPPGVVPTPLAAATPLATPPTAVPSPSVMPSVLPEQVAQLEPTPLAPTTITTNAPAPQTSVTLGTTILRNWPLLLIGLIVLAGLGLFVFARGSGRSERELPPVADAQTALPDATAESMASGVTPVATPTATPVATAAGTSAAVLAATPTAEPATSTEVAAAETTAASTATQTASAAAVSAAAAPADSDRVTAEVKKLLDGVSYDETVVNAPDAPTRALVVSELLTALATESEDERNERARAAFVQQGYFADATRDLQAAEEPKHRASAARTLGLVGDKTATPHLVAALEDPAPDVRRAGVEALAELQDPAALSALEALRWRETSRQVPRAAIQRAVEACTAAAVVAEMSKPAEIETTSDSTALADESAAVETVAGETATGESATGASAAVESVAVASAAETATAAEVDTTDDLADITLASAPVPAHAAAVVAPPTAGAPTRDGADTQADAAAEATLAAPALEDAAAPAAALPIEPVAVDALLDETPTLETPTLETRAVETPAVETVPTATTPVATPADAVIDEEATAAELSTVESPTVESPTIESVTVETEPVAPVATGAAGTDDVPALAATPAEAAADLDDEITLVTPAATLAGAAAEAPEEAPELVPDAPEPAGPRAVEARTVSAPAEHDIVDATPVTPGLAEPITVAAEPVAAEPTAPTTTPTTAQSTAPSTAPVETDFAYSAPLTTEPAPESAPPAKAAVPPAALADADDWIDIDVDEHRLSDDLAAELFGPASAPPSAPAAPSDLHIERGETDIHAPVDWSFTTDTAAAPPVADTAPPVASAPPASRAAQDSGLVLADKGIDLASTIEAEDLSIIPKAIQLKLESEDAGERAASVLALARLNTDEAFGQICTAFDDAAQEVRDAAARALYTLADDRADSFTRALREAQPERRRRVGAAIASSGLADEAISNLTGESRDKTYDAFSLLFLMAKAGETAPLLHSIETHPDNEVRLAVVKLLALSGQHDILPAFRRLAVRGSLPTEVRAAVMEAIYQISSQPQHTT